MEKNQGDIKRTIDEAIEIAKKAGVEIPEDISFHVDKYGKLAKDENIFASYTLLRNRPERKFIEWEEFYNLHGNIPVTIRPDVFESDEAIIAVFAHETHELNNLRRLFEENGGRMTYEQIARHINEGYEGNLHDKAWDFADKLVAAFRRQNTSAK